MTGARLVRAFITFVFVAILVLAMLQSRGVAIPGLGLFLAAQDLRQQPDWLTQTRLLVTDLDPEQCSASLDAAGSDGTLLPPTDTAKACHLENTVMLTRFSQAALRPEQTRCNIAARLYMWERNIVQPTAKRIYGQPVREITHFGSYNCRAIRGSSHLSQHATANAIDISGVVLKNGRTVTVKKGWNGDQLDQAFLRDIREGLCSYFNLTLSPDYNTDHKDHFHVDMGWVKDCR